MNYSVIFNKPEVKSSFDWQLIQEVNVFDEKQKIVAKAEIELITLNKHREALKSYAIIEGDDEATDWELPLNLYFKGQNLSAELCESLAIIADVKNSKTHMLIEAFSVLPEYRKQGVAKFLLQSIAKEYNKVQSITVLSLPMPLFITPEDSEEEATKAYYQQLELASDETSLETLQAFFNHNGFIQYQVDETLLNAPLSFDLFVTTPSKLIG
ncbi:MAG: GNAT family N-acetyltransferase [Thalassotalea sp.]